MADIMDGYSEWAKKHGNQYLRQKWERDRKDAEERLKRTRAFLDEYWSESTDQEKSHD